MKTSTFTAITSLAAVAAASVALAAGSPASKSASRVIFHEPEQFTDFRMSEFQRTSDTEALKKELTQAIERSTRASLPPGYTLEIRFTDIDLAGDINPFRNLRLTDVREYRSVYPPRMTFDWAILDEAGQVVRSGSERLLDLAYDMRLRMPGSDYTRIEADMLRDFITGLGRDLSRHPA